LQLKVWENKKFILDKGMEKEAKRGQNSEG
jgi:hypothetical protein